VEINIKLDGISLFLQNKEGKNKGKYMISLAEHPLENPFKRGGEKIIAFKGSSLNMFNPNINKKKPGEHVESREPLEEN
jgi:hypothetical protein